MLHDCRRKRRRDFVVERNILRERERERGELSTLREGDELQRETIVAEMPRSSNFGEKIGGNEIPLLDEPFCPANKLIRWAKVAYKCRAVQILAKKIGGNVVPLPNELFRRPNPKN